MKKLTKKGYIIKTKEHNSKTQSPARYGLNINENKGAISRDDTGGVSQDDTGAVSRDDTTKYLDIKTEEEDAHTREKKIPDKIKNRFGQIFNRELSVEFYNKLTKKYSDEKILIKALEVAEANADKPSYLLKLLSDWQNNGLTSISSINTYLEERKAKIQANKVKKETSATTNNNDRSMDELYESGYR